MNDLDKTLHVLIPAPNHCRFSSRTETCRLLWMTSRCVSYVHNYWFIRTLSKVKVKFALEQATQAQRENRGTALSFLKKPRPDRFIPGKETLYPSYRTLGWTQGRSGRMRKIRSTLEFDLRTVQTVASRYTDWAIAALKNTINATIIHCKKASCLQHPTCFGWREPSPGYV
jgi:hypothetical protein